MTLWGSALPKAAVSSRPLRSMCVTHQLGTPSLQLHSYRDSVGPLPQAPVTHGRPAAACDQDCGAKRRPVVATATTAMIPHQWTRTSCSRLARRTYPMARKPKFTRAQVKNHIKNIQEAMDKQKREHEQKGRRFVYITPEEIEKKLRRANSPFFIGQAFGPPPSPGGSFNYGVYVYNPDAK